MPDLKMQEKWSAQSSASQSTRHILLSSTFTRATSGLNCSTLLISEHDLLSLHRLQILLRVLVGDTFLSHRANPLSERGCLWTDSLLLWIVLGRTAFIVSASSKFTTRTRHATHIIANHDHFIRVPFVRIKFHWWEIRSTRTASSHESLLCVIDT